MRKPDEWRSFDSALFDGLATVVAADRQHIKALQEDLLLPGASFCDEVIPTEGTPAERRTGRAEWFRRVQDRLSNCSLIFVDPDNGLETAGFSAGRLIGGKCIALTEVVALAAPGRTLVIYHHQTRRKGGHLEEVRYWAERLRGKGFSTVDAIRSRPFSPRAFFILDAPSALRLRARQFAARWNGHLSWHEDVHASVDQ